MDYMQVLEYFSIMKAPAEERRLLPVKLPEDSPVFQLDNKVYYLSETLMHEGIGDTPETL